MKLCAASAGTRIVLSVADSGIGIDSRQKPRIFDRFYRVTQVGKHVPAGSGLGLALAKWIADRHGTELIVESEPGRGSRFSFSLQKTHLAVQPSRALDALHTESGAGSMLPSCQVH